MLLVLRGSPTFVDDYHWADSGYHVDGIHGSKSSEEPYLYELVRHDGFQGRLTVFHYYFGHGCFEAVSPALCCGCLVILEILNVLDVPVVSLMFLQPLRLLSDGKPNMWGFDGPGQPRHNAFW